MASLKLALDLCITRLSLAEEYADDYSLRAAYHAGAAMGFLITCVELDRETFATWQELIHQGVDHLNDCEYESGRDLFTRALLLMTAELRKLS